MTAPGNVSHENDEGPLGESETVTLCLLLERCKGSAARAARRLHAARSTVYDRLRRAGMTGKCERRSASTQSQGAV